MSELNDEWKHLPAAFRRRMAAQNETQDDETNDDFEHDNADETADDDFTPEHDFSDDTDNGETETPDEVAKLRNDVNAANGRVKKLEEENARLKAIEQNNAFLSQRIMQMQAQSEQAAQHNTAPTHTAQSENQDDDENERAALFDELGEVAGNAIWQARQQAKQANTQLAQMQAQIANEQQNARKMAFAREVAAQIPEIQTLLHDEHFQSFLQSKTSFDGSNALQFVAAVPEHLDVGKIPQVRALIDEFQQQGKQTKQRKTSAPPKQQSGGEFSEHAPKLKQWTPQAKAQLAKLVRKPNAKEEIAQFKAQFVKE